MASGYGINGGVSRCFPFWQDLLACYIMNTTAESDIGKFKCMDERDDYYECLHHKKEMAKQQMLADAYNKAKQGYRVTGEVRNVEPLGLLRQKVREEVERITGPKK